MSAVESRILELCRRYPQALAQDVLVTELSPHHSNADIVMGINALIQRGRLQLIRSSDDKIVYREVSEDVAAKFRGLSPEDMLIYQLIEASGNQGIWTKHLKTKSNLQQTQINKILKNLENRKLVKQVKSVEAKTRKVYMLFDLEPSRDLTGGPWYSEQDFDSAFVDELLSHIYKYIVAKNFVTLQQIAEFIKASGITAVELRDHDVQSLINALLWDGRITEVQDLRAPSSASAASFTGSSSSSSSSSSSASSVSRKRDAHGQPAGMPQSAVAYKAAGYLLEADSFTEAPCASCPVFNVCSPNSEVNPQDCAYYQTWLKLQF
jgi:DNA-directed RNA polymerase III subunit RPC6